MGIIIMAYFESNRIQFKECENDSTIVVIAMHIGIRIWSLALAVYLNKNLPNTKFWVFFKDEISHLIFISLLIEHINS